MGKEHLGGKKVPGEGTTSDKLVLESALRRVLGTGESRPVEPMELEEHEVKKEEMMEISLKTFENFEKL